MRPLMISAAVLMIFMGGSWATAGAVDGNTIYKLCKAEESFGCLMYVQGWLEGYSMRTAEVEKFKKGIPVVVCARNFNIEQVIDVFGKHLKTHPETRHQIASVLLWLALAKAFRCKP